MLGTLGSCKRVLNVLEQTVLSMLGLEGAKHVAMGSYKENVGAKGPARRKCDLITNIT